jgi:hypothetical protein
MTDHPTARETIPELLDQHRPDRYDPTDHDWQAPVVALVAAELTVAEARQIAAGKLVSTAEATATRRTNRLLREVEASGTRPLDWMDAMDWPLAVSDSERVALRAATDDDLDKFAIRERRAAANDFAARNSSCEGAIALAEAMRDQDVEFVSKLEFPEVDA